MSNLVDSLLGGAVDVDKEVGRIIRSQAEKPRSAYTIMEEIRQKVGNDDDAAIREITKKLNEKYKKIREKAEKISQRLQTKYPDITKMEAERKIDEYKTKFGLDDDEIVAVRRLIWNREDKQYPAEYTDYSPMSRALGYVPTTHNFIGKLNVPADEKEQVRAIRELNSTPQVKQLHNQVTIQSLMYNVTENLQNAAFDKFKTDVYSHINPVLFAMFFDKINYFDSNMLLASIPRIIAQRDEGLDLETFPDFELYRGMATDPNETECVSASNKPFSDLLARSNVQIKIWENVLQLRRGRYYINDMGLFNEALSACKANVFDAGDLAYIRDEGTTMRKILGVFSMRPTWVSTSPSMGISSNIAQIGIKTITRVPMLQLRFGFNDPATKQYELKDVLLHQQQYISNKQIIIKTQEVLASDKIVVVYVNRRHHDMNLGVMVAPYNTVKLPLTINSNQKVFDAFVNVPDYLEVKTNKFHLKSIITVVTVSISNNIEGTLKENLIMGSAANVLLPGGADFVRYEPMCLTNPETTTVAATNASSDKIYPVLKAEKSVIISEACTRGTVFLYTTGEVSPI